MSKDHSNRVRLTAGRVEAFSCPPAKSQAFLWDTEVPSLLLRVTPTGRKTYAFEGRLNGQTVRIGIGTAAEWSLDKARKRAAELKMQVDSGVDPREIHRQQIAVKDAAQAERVAQALTVGEVWGRYLAERQPHWGARTHQDHIKMADAGGVRRKRGEGVTVPGPLAHFMSMRLVDLTGAAVEAWALKEAQSRPASVRLALRLLKAFLRWAAAEPDLAGRVEANAANAKKAREAAGRASLRDDVLERGQLAAWFRHVTALPNPVAAAYLQVLLLTGARPGEVLAMRWEDVDAQWKGLTIRDKVEGERVIPLTPYVEHLLSGLPRRNAWVFSSTRAVSLDPRHVERRQRYHEGRGREAQPGAVVDASESGRLAEPRQPHVKACAAAGLEGLTLHGLRRSFASLTEWLEIPAGVVAQIQGHKPSATAEKHYKRRPLDLLRVHHERIEAWILEQACVELEPVQGRALQAVRFADKAQ